MEARGGIEPPIMVLQTIALPLGDRAFGGKQFSVFSFQFSVFSFQFSVFSFQFSVFSFQFSVFSH
jgi:hypothetical protein